MMMMNTLNPGMNNPTWQDESKRAAKKGFPSIKIRLDQELLSSRTPNNSSSPLLEPDHSSPSSSLQQQHQTFPAIIYHSCSSPESTLKIQTIKNAQNTTSVHLCRDVIHIICSFLSDRELWLCARYINSAFHDESLRNDVWKKLYLNKYRSVLDPTEVIIHREARDDHTEWWKLFMEREIWSQFRFSTKEKENFLLQEEFCELFQSSLAQFGPCETYYLRIIAFKNLAVKHGFLFYNDAFFHGPKFGWHSFLKVGAASCHSIPRVDIESILLLGKRILHEYSLKLDVSLNLPDTPTCMNQILISILYILVQAYSIIGEFSKVIVYCCEIIERTRKAEHCTILCKLLNRLRFYRGYSLFRMGQFTQARKDLRTHLEYLQWPKCDEELRNPHSIGHLLNVYYTLMMNEIQSRNVEAACEYFKMFLGQCLVMDSIEQYTSCSSNFSSNCLEMFTQIENEILSQHKHDLWEKINSTFPSLPYLPLAEHFYEKRRWKFAKHLFQQFESVSFAHNNTSRMSLEDKSVFTQQIAHAKRRISQINAMLTMAKVF
ncbi:hypothetical protein C9374_005295 [Naegleria lovaniensis]|uniref:F-box domain-containing protein n=1 Tax=Naegleria lovaniensis TaxID=51637 RepID=A0AA88KKK9_NAELO|nr:uncharacterized protein C9374_005295 [Naegleria lovaniensis]KAG2382715.1 hypothetical protein C9374_005295 [Naegleria lovaniensis]